MNIDKGFSDLTLEDISDLGFSAKEQGKSFLDFTKENLFFSVLVYTAAFSDFYKDFQKLSPMVKDHSALQSVEKSLVLQEKKLSDLGFLKNGNFAFQVPIRVFQELSKSIHDQRAFSLLADVQSISAISLDFVQKTYDFLQKTPDLSKDQKFSEGLKSFDKLLSANRFLSSSFYMATKKVPTQFVVFSENFEDREILDKALLSCASSKKMVACFQPSVMKRASELSIPSHCYLEGYNFSDALTMSFYFEKPQNLNYILFPVSAERFSSFSRDVQEHGYQNLRSFEDFEKRFLNDYKPVDLSSKDKLDDFRIFYPKSFETFRVLSSHKKLFNVVSQQNLSSRQVFSVLHGYTTLESCFSEKNNLEGLVRNFEKSVLCVGKLSPITQVFLDMSSSLKIEPIIFNSSVRTKEKDKESFLG